MPETNRVEHLTIVGGGTAGWLTALIVGSLINNSRDGAPVRITLIESPNVPSVGVGEATVPSIPSIMRKLGIDETELIRRCNASFKMSVRFDRWFRESSGAWRTFHHPFNSPAAVGGICTAYHFHRYGPGNRRTQMAECVIPNVAVAQAGKGPRMVNGGDYDRALGYAYHLDAALLASFLRDVAARRGVEHVLDDVEEILQDERGYVSALKLKKAGMFPVEFVIDCSGFRSLILEKVLQEPFISLGDQLLNDRAIPVQLPHRKPTEINPYTGATALTAGWVWRVPLFSRLGTGYVYSSSFKGDDEARSEFLQHLRATGDLPVDAPDPETRVIKMRVGHARRSWVKNCVAIGLSAGFVEPLEATGIFLIDVAARWFVGHFPDKRCSPVLADRYNQLMNGLYAEVRDFIQLHYATTNRSEPYWLASRKDVKLSDTLTSNLEVWRHRMPEAVDTRTSTLFHFWSFIYVLEQKDFFKNLDLPLEGSISREHWTQYRDAMSKQTAELIHALPKHHDLLASIRNKNAPPHALLMRTRT